MQIKQIEKRLRKELKKRGLHLVWCPQPDKLRKDELVVFGAEQKLGTKKPLIAGFGPGGFQKSYGNSPMSKIRAYQDALLDALEVVGIPRGSLHSHYPHVCRGKIWPTFLACLTQETFLKLKSS